MPNKIGISMQGFYGWKVLASMMVIRGVAGGINLYGSTLFILPVQDEFKITRGIVATVFAAGLVIRNLTSPISGYLIDRYGAKKMLLLTLFLSSSGYILMIFAENIYVFTIIYLALVSLGFHVLLFQAPSVIINNWFDRHKGFSMSLLQVGAGIGGGILVPILGYLIAEEGWRFASAMAGLFLLIIGLPILYIARDTPEEMNQHPDGIRPKNQSISGKKSSSGATLKEAILTRQYWIIVIVLLAFSSAVSAVAFHFAPILEDKNMSPVTQAGLLGTLAFLSAPVIVLTGWLGDRTDKLKVSAVIIFIIALGIMLLNLGQTVTLMALSALLMAGTQGVYPLLWAVTGDVFGRRDFGTIRGSIEGIMVFGLAAPSVVGFIYDWQGSYTFALWISAGLCLGAAAIAGIASFRSKFTSLFNEL